MEELMTTTRFDLVTIPRTGSGGSSRFWGGLAKLLPWKRGALMAFFLSTRIFSHAGSQPMPVAANPDSTIVKLADTYRKAVLAEEAAGLLALYREDAIAMPPFQPPIVGRAAIEQFYRRTFQGPVKVTEFTFSHTETTIHGDVACDVGSYKRIMSGAPTGTIEAEGPT
jgi:ketosteroid isomerase-like protein